MQITMKNSEARKMARKALAALEDITIQQPDRFAQRTRVTSMLEFLTSTAATAEVCLSLDDFALLTKLPIEQEQ